MIKCSKLSPDDEARLNRYVNALIGNPHLLDCERLFEQIKTTRCTAFAMLTADMSRAPLSS